MDDRIRPIKREASREEAVIKAFACVFMLALFVGIPCLVVARIMDGCTELSREWHEAGVRASTDRAIESDRLPIAEHEYPSDSEMQRFVYDRQIAAYRYMASVTDADAKQIALREYPNDFAMQQYVYNRQLSAKRYMATVADAEVKRIALREYPNDFAMQQYVYNRQLSAKQYMAAMPNGFAKQQAIREYPYDYTMQKFTYDRLLR